MRNKAFQALVALLTSIFFAFSAVALPEAVRKPDSSQTESQAASIERFLSQVSKPEPRTYRQILASLRLFVPGDFLDHMNKKLQSHLDVQFPQYQLKDNGKTYSLILGTGTQVATLEIQKNDPKIFAKFQDQVISHKEAKDPWAFLEKIQKGAEVKTKPNVKAKKASVVGLLAIPDAQAFMPQNFNWALFGGLSVLGIGIAMGFSKLANAKIKTKHEVDVKLPEEDVDVNVNFDIPRLSKTKK